ncbi:MAG: ABC transporter ATP-binding protein [Burkholderiaceae bacterium]|nr:ABC transporter ATP-binding protein [Burkholderiaceae bacterium]
MTIVAEWNGVTRRYGAVTAVQDISLALRAGEATALVGHNGAGKTTLIKLMLGLVRPDAGAVRVLGVDPAGARGAQARRALGFLPENVAFHGALTARESMAFYARLKRVPLRENDALLERVGIAHAADRRVATYSKGMRQRLGIAQALIGEPRLLLFDEPTSGLDPDSRAEVYETIDELRRSGATVLVSTHALEEVERRVDRAAIVHRGRLVAAGSLEELRRGAGAQLRLRVRVRDCTTSTVLARMPATVRVAARDVAALTLLAPVEAKMPVLRALGALGDIVEDVEIDTPGLQQLYREWIEASDAEVAAS